MNRDPQTYGIVGAAMEVHRHLKRGFLEAVYQDALAVEFSGRKIDFTREVLLPVFYKKFKLPSSYKADFVCFQNVIVEIKAMVSIGDPEAAQLLNYMKITKMKIGLLLNFGAQSLEYKRLIGCGEISGAKQNSLFS
ncbi:MAG: GxxExxY protein [Verrucomicrobiae bacterium]|nr:GxxExxY protein [Verrucomicrobiae bacterium]